VNTEKRLEIEVKIKAQRLEPLRRVIIGLPAVLEAERAFERNIVFDSERVNLRERGMLLRLRRTGERAVLTLKAPVAGDSRYKVREETEVAVSDFAAAEKIIAALGFRVFFIYEKYREVFSAGMARIMIDETPIGDFIEIEGEPDRIDAVAARLGFAADDYIRDSYYQLFLRSGRSGHMVFGA
jgi:adenylate cyclase class 2